MEWVAVARTVWAHRRKLYAAAAMLAPFALTMMLVLFTLFAGGGSPATNEAALATPQCSQQMQAQGVDPGKGVKFGPGPVNNGKAVIAAGVALDVPEHGIVAGLSAAMQETRMLNLANPHVPDSLALTHDGLGADRDSVGVLQQSAAWGPPGERMSPAAAAAKFFTAMRAVPGWETLPAGELAGAVQRAAWPQAYLDDVPAARQFYREHLGDVRATSCPTDHAMAAVMGEAMS